MAKLDIEKVKKTTTAALPSFFTVGNIAFGFFAILAAIDKNFSMAGWFIILAMIMDILDGRIARLVKGESKFGVEIDSLADFLSFGLAPAYIMYLFHLKDYGFWGYPPAFIYVLCGAFRLARFNVSSKEEHQDAKVFTGLPIPAAAGILASFVIVYSLFELDTDMRSIKIISRQMPFLYNVIPLVMLGLGFLMISKIPYASFKYQNLLKPKTFSGVIFFVAFIFLIIRYPQDAIFLIFSLYVISGIIAMLWRGFKNITHHKNHK
jgi:CDP-diacylglycerol--serine O-phosphatidyltransferase